MVPRANRRTTPGAPFHEYGNDRCRLWMRILGRCAAVAEKQGLCPRKAIEAFVMSCFSPVEERTTFAAAPLLLSSKADSRSSSAPATTVTLKRPLGGFQLKAQDEDQCASDTEEESSAASTASSSSSYTPPKLLQVSRESMSLASSSDYLNDSVMSDSDDSQSSCSDNEGEWMITKVGQDDVTQLLCWAVFNKPLELFEEWEHEEVQRCFQCMQETYGLVFPRHSTGRYKARQLSFEDVTSLYRPLLVYLVVYFTKYIVCYGILRMVGFVKCKSSEGLVGWYRPAREDSEHLLPLLFFHGIAPCGAFFYLPMVLAGFSYDGRAVFLFENPNISCEFAYSALTEKETAAGVVEIVDRFIDPQRGLSVVGHSFGTFTAAWMLRYKDFADRIQQYVLLDPVSLVLSEPYVLNNFVYKKGLSHTRLVAGSELFTEYYLRRYFHHYNSELWLEDLPHRIETIVALSGADEIVNAPKVKEYIDCFGVRESLRMFYWEGVGHAYCVPIPSMWKQIKLAMLQQELKILQLKKE